jgi:arabinose-5-phosphate isomerase
VLKFNFAAMAKDIQLMARQAIETEALAISGLGQYIDDRFERAVKIIFNNKGRLIISGIGKSAIIGQKMVATFNSTGTPSLFMHAADAIHGDLGMIQQADIILLISKSGESPEIKVLLPLLKNFGNTVIAMSGNPLSYLAVNSDIFLNTAIDKEACPNNLAPTTSTTAQLVMGDALAVCLMELKGFNDSDFARLHPGGNLGKRLYLKVDDLYKQNAKPKVSADTPLKKVIVEISGGRLGATAIVDEHNKVQGIVTDGNVRRLLEKTDDLKNIAAKDLAGFSPKKILPSALAVEALEALRIHDISQLIVTNEQDEYLGIVHLHDLVREGIV